VENIRATVGEKELALEGTDRSQDDDLFLPNHPIIGTDFNGQLLLFDKRRADKRGENPVLVWSNNGGVVESFTNFSTMLRKIAAGQRRKLGGEQPRGDPKRKRVILEALRRVLARRQQKEPAED
jgi:hypothetical protein